MYLIVNFLKAQQTTDYIFNSTTDKTERWNPSAVADALYVKTGMSDHSINI